jgi:hypothetical protein
MARELVEDHRCAKPPVNLPETACVLAQELDDLGIDPFDSSHRLGDLWCPSARFLACSVTERRRRSGMRRGRADSSRQLTCGCDNLHRRLDIAALPDLNGPSAERPIHGVPEGPRELAALHAAALASHAQETARATRPRREHNDATHAHQDPDCALSALASSSATTRSPPRHGRPTCWRTSIISASRRPISRDISVSRRSIAFDVSVCQVLSGASVLSAASRRSWTVAPTTSAATSSAHAGTTASPMIHLR